jgi:hypothetical protein
VPGLLSTEINLPTEARDKYMCPKDIVKKEVDRPGSVKRAGVCDAWISKACFEVSESRGEVIRIGN